jgi:hypothetical protein
LLAEAKRYLEAGDSAKGLPLLQKAAEAGSVESMNRLGDWYENDDRDYARARQWFQKAAEAGDTHAMNHLGYLYEHGSGVTQDYAQAREWYQKAADAGNAAAKQALARLPSNSSTIASGRTSPEPATPSPSVNEQPAGAAVPPPPHRYATDYANLLRPETLALLNAQLADYERQTSNQFLVAIFSRLPPATDQEAFTREVFRAWKPGQANLNNGAILFVFVREHQVWIQPGKGLTQFLTVDVERHITRDVIAPAFKAGDYDRGVLDGMQAMMAAAKDAYNGDGHTHAER